MSQKALSIPSPSEADGKPLERFPRQSQKDVSELYGYKDQYEMADDSSVPVEAPSEGLYWEFPDSTLHDTDQNHEQMRADSWTLSAGKNADIDSSSSASGECSASNNITNPVSPLGDLTMSENQPGFTSNSNQDGPVISPTDGTTA
ncbi:hypothetical protein LTS18_002226, partial [Coniosporium uncinatum]